MAQVEIDVIGRDSFSAVLGNFGNIITGIKSAIDLMTGAFEAAVNAIEPFIASASESEIAITSLDTVLRSTAGGAGYFQETVGQLSNVQLSNLYNQLESAKNKLAEMKDEFGNARTYTEQETIALAAQRDIIASLEAQIQRGTDGLVIFRDTTQLTRDQLLELASALQDVTKYSDEQVLAAEAMMLRFENVNSTIFPQAIRLATDLAQSLGIDLTTAARMVGMALDDPEQGIGRLNMQFRIFNDTEMETIKLMAANGDIAGAQALILERLTEKVGGAAEAFGKTFAGQVAIAKNKLDEMRETLGGPITFLLGNLLDKLMEFADTNPVIQGVLRFFETFNNLLRSEEFPFLISLAGAFAELRDLSPVFLDITFALVAFQTALNEGQSPLDAFNAALENLLTQWEGTPLEGIITQIQNFIQTGQTEGWGTAIRNLFLTLWTELDLINKIRELVDRLTGIIGEADWSPVENALANVLSGALLTVLNGLSTLVSTVNWGPLGAALRVAFGAVLMGMLEGIGDGFWTWFATSVFGDPDQETFWAGVREGFGNFQEIFLTILVPPTTFYRYREKFAEIGRSIVDGIIDGLEQIPIIGWWATWVDEHLIQPIRRFLRIASPSAVFMEIGRYIVLGLWEGMDQIWTSFTTWVAQKFSNLLDNLSWENIVAVLTGQMSIADLFGSTGGSIGGGVNTGPGGTLPPTTTGGGGVLTGGTIINQYFYGNVYVGAIDELLYDCAQTNPLLQAGASTVSIMP